MRIVIDISEDDYRKAQDGRASVSMMQKVIRNGTPLPKGHGRLIDADALYEDLVFPNEQFSKAFKEILDDAPTIIKANNAKSEDKE